MLYPLKFPNNGRIEPAQSPKNKGLHITTDNQRLIIRTQKVSDIPFDTIHRIFLLFLS